MTQKTGYKSLWRTIWSCSQIMMAIGFNKLFYYLKKIPLIKKLIPETVYRQKDVKQVLSVLGWILEFLGLFAGKILYVVLVIWLPVFFLAKDGTDQYQYCIFMLFCMSFLIGSFEKSMLLSNDMNKYICVNLMRISARDFLLGQFLLKHGKDLIGFAAVLSVLAVLYGRSPLEGIVYSLQIVLLHLLGEAIALFIFDRKQLKLYDKAWYAFPFILVCIGLGYLPLIMNFELNIRAFLYNPFFAAAAAAAGIAGFIYIWRYARYRWLVRRTVDIEILVSVSKMTREAKFSDVQMKEQDLDIENTKKFDHLKGYDYLNAIFFERHKRILNRPVKMRLIIMAGIFAAGMLVRLFVPELALAAAEKIPGMQAVCIFIMYLMTSSSERVCRAMFRNCDISLLHYGFYRQPAIILYNFRLRLKKIIKPNLLMGAMLAIGLVSYVYLNGVSWSPEESIFYAVSILLLAVFFSVHYLFLYYIFQPYTTELAVKSPFYNIINWAVYILCYAALQIDAVPGWFSLIILGCTLVYIAAALLLINRFAPKNFKIK